MKSLLLPILGVAVFITLVGLYTKNYGSFPGAQTPLASPAQTQTPSEMTIGRTKINIEVADTEDSRRNGLSGRTSLDPDSGMLFVFPQKGLYPSFWMKDMRFPLDFIWISGGKVVKIDKYIPAPAPNTPDSQLTLYYPNEPIDYVLEVNAGFSDKNNVQVGDSVTLPL